MVHIIKKLKGYEIESELDHENSEMKTQMYLINNTFEHLLHNSDWEDDDIKEYRRMDIRYRDIQDLDKMFDYLIKTNSNVINILNDDEILYTIYFDGSKFILSLNGMNTTTTLEELKKQIEYVIHPTKLKIVFCNKDSTDLLQKSWEPLYIYTSPPKGKMAKSKGKMAKSKGKMAKSKGKKAKKYVKRK